MKRIVAVLLCRCWHCAGPALWPWRCEGLQSSEAIWQDYPFWYGAYMLHLHSACLLW